MKKKNTMQVSRLRKVYNIINHDEKLQNLIIIICCFGLIGIITLYCLLFG